MLLDTLFHTHLGFMCRLGDGQGVGVRVRLCWSIPMVLWNQRSPLRVRVDQHTFAKVSFAVHKFLVADVLICGLVIPLLDQECLQPPEDQVEVRWPNVEHGSANFWC